MQAYERKQLLERVRREGATVGATIPETIDLQGESFELRAFVFETKSLDRVPAGRREEVEEVKRLLRRERRERVRRIESGDVTREEGEAEASAVVGIDRALNVLESLGPTDLEGEAQAREAADRKRWMSFLRKALGRGSDTKRGRLGR